MLRYFVTFVYLREVKYDNRRLKISRLSIQIFKNSFICFVQGVSDPSMTELIQDFSEWKTLAFLMVLHFFNKRFRKILATFH